MATTSFVDKTTVIPTAWLNDVNTLAYTIFGASFAQLLMGNGSAAAPSHSFLNGTGDGFWRLGSNNIGWSTGGTGQGQFVGTDIRLTSVGRYSWGAGVINSTADLILERDAAAILALRNTTTAQVFRVYNTFTDASNYERLELGAAVGSNAANTFGVAATKAGTGTARDLMVQGQRILFQTAGANNRWMIDATGHLTALTDNTLDIGAVAATRPRSIYAGASIASGTQTLTDQATITWDANSGANGTVTLTASRIMAAPTNLRNGAKYVLTVVQNASGGWALTWNAVFKGLYGAAMPQPNSALSTTTVFVFESDGTNLFLVNLAKQQTVQVLTSGSSATYTTPAGCVKIRVRMVGGGGGGVGATAGGAGGATTFSTLTANGGAAPGTAGAAVVAAATASGGDVNISGATGTIGCNTAVSNTGCPGANSVFGGGGGGGAGSASAPTAGGNAAANSGSGGGGGGSAAQPQGSGGNAGAYCEKTIVLPAATYTYTVGAAGTAGAAGGSNAISGTGGAGLIIVEEFYIG